MNAQCESGEPLSKMARWNRCALRDDIICRPALDAPELSPNTVMRVTSPPKYAMLSLTHCSAST